MLRALVVLLAYAAFLAAPAVGARPRVIQGDKVIGGARIGATVRQASARLGRPENLAKLSRYECRATWQSLGLVATFVDLSTGDPCGAGVLLGATARSADWRTGPGLRIGDPVTTLRRLYPHARLHAATPTAKAGYWLVARRTCTEAGGNPYPGLLARVGRARISAFVVSAAACE
jgi:hypothetical protein